MFEVLGSRVDWRDPEPARELVAAHDILRTDQLGRRYVIVPKGQSPHSRVKLTEQEREALIVPPDPPKDGSLEPLGTLGFRPRNTTLGGFTIESGSTR